MGSPDVEKLFAEIANLSIADKLRMAADAWERGDEKMMRIARNVAELATKEMVSGRRLEDPAAWARERLR